MCKSRLTPIARIFQKTSMKMLFPINLFAYATVALALFFQGCSSDKLSTLENSAAVFPRSFNFEFVFIKDRNHLRTKMSFIPLRGGGLAGAERTAEHLAHSSFKGATSIIEPDRKIEHQRSGIQLFPGAGSQHVDNSACDMHSSFLNFEQC